MTFTEVLPPDAERTGQWYARRRDGITASEVAAILGLSRWESPWSLWHRKKGLLDEEPDNDAMRWGRKLEALIADEFDERHPYLHVLRIGLVSRDGWKLATPDRGLWETTLGVSEHPVGALECKTADSWDEWGDDGTDVIPVYYRCQLLWQMHVLGVDCGFVAALSRGKDYREYVVTMDDDARADLQVMIQAAEEFRASLAADEPPPLDAHTATTRALRTLHPAVEDRDVVVPDHLAETYAEAKRTVELAKADLDGATNELLAAIGDGRRAVTADGAKVATRIVSERRSLDTKALAADHPDIAEKYRKTTTVAQLRAAPAPKKEGTIR